MRIKLAQKLMVALMTVSTFLCLGGVAMADPYLNYPGTRARAMGGAFTAIASDASAMWYNPAGLALKGKDVIVEYSSAVKLSDEAPFQFEDTDNTFFVAGKWASGDKAGFGLAFYEPYALTFDVNSIETDGTYYQDTISGTLIEDMNILSMGFGNYFDENKNFSLGVTFEIVWFDFSESQLQFDNYNDPIIFTPDDSAAMGFSGSVGALYTLPWQPLGIVTNIGANYRLKSFGGSTTMPLVLEGADIALEKPTSWDAGVSIAKSITPIYSTLTLSAQRGNTDYGSMNDNLMEYSFDKTSFGAELVYSKQFLFFRDIAFRIGAYTSDLDVSDYTVKGKSFGIGTRIGEQFGLEVASENRDYNGEYDLDLQSVAATWAF